MRQYRINGEFLDNFDNDSFAISKAISKIGEINLRHGDRSTGFKVKWTSKNIKLLNYITILNSANNSDSFKKILGQIVEDDVVISDGYFQVTKFNPYKKDIDIRFYGGNTDWFSELKDKKINESDIPGAGSYNVDDLFNISISADNIVNSFAGDLTPQNPYKFFLVDNNKDSLRNQANFTTFNTFVDDYQIGFSQGVIFDRIFESLGIKLDGNMFEDAKYYNTLITKSIPLPRVVSASSSLRNTAYLIGGQENEQSLPNAFSPPSQPLNFIESTPIPEWDGTKVIAKNDASGIFFTGSLQCRTINDNTQNRPLTIEVYRNNSIISSVTQTINETVYDDLFGSGSAFYLYDFEIDLSTLTISSGDEIEVRYLTDFNPSSSYWTDLSDRATEWETRPFLEFDLIDYIKEEVANEFLPSLNRDKFVKDVLSQFGAATQYNAGTKTLNCNKLNIIDDRRIYAPDWSNKIDLSKPPTIDLVKLVQNYSKRSFYKYAETDEADVLNKVYEKQTNYRLGDGAIQINNDFLKDEEEEIYESIYSPTITSATFPSDLTLSENLRGNFFLPVVPLFTFTGVDEGDIRQYDDNELNTRKFIYSETVDISSTYKGACTQINVNDFFVDAQSSVLPLVYFDKGDYPNFASSPLNQINDSLSFGQLTDLTANYYDIGNPNIRKNTILEENYLFQTKILNNPIYLEIYLKLSPLDVQNVDFFTPIFLDFDLDSGYYYIDEISQYKGQDQSTKVKLVKI